MNKCASKGTQYHDYYKDIMNNYEDGTDFLLLTPSGKYVPFTRMKSVNSSENNGRSMIIEINIHILNIVRL